MAPKNNLSNPAYWDTRYRKQGLEGSGAGSQDAAVARKVDFIQGLIDQYGVQGIFDYGCGNARVLKALKVERRMGYDHSAEVVRMLQVDKPLQTDFSNDSRVATPEYMAEFDAILCNEVLFHNSNPERERILRAIAAARSRLFICCDTLGNVAAKFLQVGSHIDSISSRKLVERIFPSYQEVANQRFNTCSELYALLRIDI